MKPIGNEFGFWLLLTIGIMNLIYERPICASIFIVGAALFNAIHSLNKQSN